jgi:filamentous hemagglutinin
VIGAIGKAQSIATETKALGSVSFSAVNGIGQLYSPSVLLSGSTAIFNDFSVGTARGFMGLGAKGAAELLGPMRELIKYAQQAGAKQITLAGKYVTEEGARLGGGKIGESFSHTFEASASGLKSFIKQLGGAQ